MARIRSRLLAIAAASSLAFLITMIPPARVGTNTMALSLENWPVEESSVVWAAPSADASTTLVVIDAPRGTAGTELEVRGWAADPGAPGGTGVDRVDVYLDGERDAGGTRLGQATYGLQRPDVAAHLRSPQFLLSGFALRTTVAPGPHTLYVYAHPSDQPADQGWAPPKQSAVLAAPGTGPPNTAGIAGPVGAIPYDPAVVGAYYPPGFDFSLGAGYDFYGLGYWAVPRYLPYYGGYDLPWYPYGRGYFLGNRYPDYFFDYQLPGYLRGGRYCPLYSGMVC